MQRASTSASPPLALLPLLLQALGPLQTLQPLCVALALVTLWPLLGPSAAAAATAVTADTWSSQAQVQALDLAQTDPDLKGFVGGFAHGDHGYVVPYNNNGARFGKVVRFRLADFAGVQVLDLSQTDPDLKGFAGGFAHGDHGYVVPHYHGAAHFGKVVRFRLADFAGVQVLDLSQTDPDLRGFVGGFAHGDHGYVVPYNNPAPFGKVVRFRLADFAGVEVLDLSQTDSDLKGFVGGFAYGDHGYVVPYDNGAAFGKVARFRLADFTEVEVLDLSQTDPDLKGFQGGFAHGHHGYVVPYYSGTVVRFRLADFAGVEVLDLSQTDSDLKGFVGGFAHGDHGYVVPYYNGAAFGKVARFRLADFTGVEVLDLSQTDPDLKGFWGGFAHRDHGYVVPRSNGANFGKVACFSLATTTTTTSTTATTLACPAGTEHTAGACSPCPPGTQSDASTACFPVLGFVATQAEVAFVTQGAGYGMTLVQLVASTLPAMVYGGSTVQYAVDLARELANLSPTGNCSSLWLPWNEALRATLSPQDLNQTCETNMSLTADEVVWAGYIGAFLLERTASGTREVRRWTFPISFHLNRSVAAFYSSVYALDSSTPGPEVRVPYGTAESTLELFLTRDYTLPQRSGLVLHDNDTVYLEQRLVQAITGIGLDVTSVWLEGTGLQGGPIRHDLTSTLHDMESGASKVRTQVTLRSCIDCQMYVKSNMVVSQSEPQGRRLRGPASTLASMSLSVLGPATVEVTANVNPKGPANPDLPLTPPACLIVAAATALFFSMFTRLAISVSKRHQRFAGFACVEFIDVITDIMVYIGCRGEGDLQFGNDENGLLAIALLTSTSLNMGLLALELALYLLGPKCLGYGLPAAAVPWLACIHLMLEDCFQLVLYALVSGAQTTEGLGQRPAVLFAVAQSGLFILWKLKDAVDWEAIAARTSWTGVATTERAS